MYSPAIVAEFEIDILPFPCVLLVTPASVMRQESRSLSGVKNYTRRQINLYRMFFADFSVNSQPILMKFCKDCFQVMRRVLWNFHQKILYSSKVKPFDM